MKKKIAIFEIEYHLGFVKTLVELIDFNKYSLTIYTTQSNLRDLREFLGLNYKKVIIYKFLLYQWHLCCFGALVVPLLRTPRG